jgi:hypothetical protein
MKVGAIRRITAHASCISLPVSNLSLPTVVSDTTRLAALDVGIPSAHIASEQRNSLIEDLRTALPSPFLEYGVGPPPLI